MEDQAGEGCELVAPDCPGLVFPDEVDVAEPVELNRQIDRTVATTWNAM